MDPRQRLKTLGLAFIALSFIEGAWVLFCLFGGLVLGLVGLADEDLMMSALGGGAYALLALVNLPIALLQLAAGIRLRQAKGLYLTMGAIAATLAALVLALYCFPFSAGVLVYALVTLSDAETRAVLDAD